MILCSNFNLTKFGKAENFLVVQLWNKARFVSGSSLQQNEDESGPLL